MLRLFEWDFVVIEKVVFVVGIRQLNKLSGLRQGDRRGGFEKMRVL